MDMLDWRRRFFTLLLVFIPLCFSVDTAQAALISNQLDPLELSTQQHTLLSSETVQVSQQSFSVLSDAILFYEALQRSGLWQAIGKGPLLKRGDFHQQITILRNQLFLLGDLSSVTMAPLSSQLFDVGLETALKHFQKRHSLKADGVLGPQTRDALNVQPWERIDQLVLNIYRQNLLNMGSSEVYVHVNLPEYRLRVYKQGDVILEMKTIIGQRKRQTPVMSTTVRQVVINPSWNVPKSIAIKDIIPRWQQDADYLKKHNLQVLAGWTTPRTFVQDNDVEFHRLYRGANYQRFWESPGEANTLGQVKFPLTSGNSIYLHDTSARYLFNAQKRALSSGCIRLEKPRELANVLIAHSNQRQPQTLDPLFKKLKTVPVRLQKPIPVHITYWTAWLTEQGELHFSNDPYRRDATDFALFQQQQKQLLNSSPAEPGRQVD